MKNRRRIQTVPTKIAEQDGLVLQPVAVRVPQGIHRAVLVGGEDSSARPEADLDRIENFDALGDGKPNDPIGSVDGGGVSPRGNYARRQQS